MQATLIMASEMGKGLVIEPTIFDNVTADITIATKEICAPVLGIMSVNSDAAGGITTAFGGYKLSGFGGPDNAFAAHDQYTETKTVWIELSEDKA